MGKGGLEETDGKFPGDIHHRDRERLRRTNPKSRPAKEGPVFGMLANRLARSLRG